MNIYVGIDPGATGAIAVLHGDTAYVHDIGGSIHDAIDTLRECRGTDTVVCIERVNAMPKQGLASTFKFGVIYGELRGACLALGLAIRAEPTPQTWKRALFKTNFSKLAKLAQKTLARDTARTLYPSCAAWLSRVKDADRAEAILLAHYLRTLLEETRN